MCCVVYGLKNSTSVVVEPMIIPLQGWYRCIFIFTLALSYVFCNVELYLLGIYYYFSSLLLNWVECTDKAEKVWWDCGDVKCNFFNFIVFNHQMRENNLFKVFHCWLLPNFITASLILHTHTFQVTLNNKNDIYTILNLGFPILVS